MTLTRGNIKKQIRRLIGPGETRTERGMRTQYFDVDEVSRVKDALDQAATLVNEDHDGDTSIFDYETSDGKEFRLLHNSRVAYIDHSYMDESSSRFKEYSEYSLQGEIENYIDYAIDGGLDPDDLIDDLVIRFGPDSEAGLSKGEVYDALDIWEANNNDDNEEATIGDIERFIDEMEQEGFPEDEALEMASKRYGLSTREILNMLEGTHNQALKYLDQLAESLEQFSDTFFPDEEIEEDEEI